MPALGQFSSAPGTDREQGGIDQEVQAQRTGEILPLVAGLVVWCVVFLLFAPRAAGSSLLLFVAAVDGHVSHGFQKQLLL